MPKIETLSDQEIEKLFNDIYNGYINDLYMPVNLYTMTSENLISAVFRGYGGTFIDFDINSPAYDVLKKIHENTHRLSAAKTFQNVRDIQTKIFDNKGFLRSFTDFRKDAEQIYDIYNKTWLKTEYVTATRNSQMASQWQDIVADKDVLPYLRFQTVNDSRVRPEHQTFDGVVKPVDDPFWNYAVPPLGFNCRCIVTQHDETWARKETKEKDLPSKNEVHELFRFNPGKETKIFKESGGGLHPYFIVGKKYQSFKEKNFGLPIPNIK